MAVEINDQKLIDIVYVDDEGNKHKYSGPFINDLTITTEIQEKLTALDTLNIQVSELKTKLDTLNATVLEEFDNGHITFSEYAETGNTIPSYAWEKVVMPRDDSEFPIIYIVKNAVTYGWIDLTKLFKLENNSTFYTGIKQYNLDTVPWYYKLAYSDYWSNKINSYLPPGLNDIASIVINDITLYDNGAATNAAAHLTTDGTQNWLKITDSDGSIYTIYLDNGFKPEE